MTHPLNRLPPNMGPESYKSYTIRAPISTHWRRATCDDYECDFFLHGGVTTVDVSTELGKKQYHFLSHDKTRRWHTQRAGETLYRFVYGPGNNCFSNTDEDPRRHIVPIGRPPLVLVSGGDWRGNPLGTPTVRHRSVEDWVDDFANHQDRLKTAIERG